MMINAFILIGLVVLAVAVLAFAGWLSNRPARGEHTFRAGPPVPLGPSPSEVHHEEYAIPMIVPGREDRQSPPPQPAASTTGPRAALPGEPSNPAGGTTWPRKAIARRIQGLRKWSWITQENIAARLPGPLASHVDPFSRGMRRYLRRRTISRRIQTLRTWRAFTRPRRQPSTEERQAMALAGEMHHEDTGGLQTAPLPAGCTAAFANIARIGAELAKPKAEADDTGVLAAIRDGG